MVKTSMKGLAEMLVILAWSGLGVAKKLVQDMAAQIIVEFNKDCGSRTLLLYVFLLLGFWFVLFDQQKHLVFDQ